jgi:uncharacterized protein YhaN
MVTTSRTLVIVALTTLHIMGCSGLYYSTMETLGVPKREILSDRVGKARAEQETAKDTFESALEQFRSVVTSEPGELEQHYNHLKDHLDRCASRAEAVSSRIESIEAVAMALFKEWEGELSQYNNETLRAQSEKKLQDTQSRYEQLISAMRRAEGKMAPVLQAFQEQVLYMKHNLNAAAIASLQGEVVAIERNVADLVAEMERAIAEADSFIAESSGS